MEKIKIENLTFTVLRKSPYKVGANDQTKPDKKLHVSLNENTGYRHGTRIYEAEANGMTLLIPENLYLELTKHE